MQSNDKLALITGVTGRAYLMMPVRKNASEAPEFTDIGSSCEELDFAVLTVGTGSRHDACAGRVHDYDVKRTFNGAA